MVTLLTFELASHPLALPVHQVREVLRAVAITPLPDAPPIVEGVIDLRGTLVPVIDLRWRFHLPPRAPHPDEHFIVATMVDRLVAWRVDRAQALIPVDESTIRPATVLAPASSQVAGVVQRPDGLLVIYDLERCLSLSEGLQIDLALAFMASPS